MRNSLGLIACGDLFKGTAHTKFEFSICLQNGDINTMFISKILCSEKESSWDFWGKSAYQ